MSRDWQSLEEIKKYDDSYWLRYLAENTIFDTENIKAQKDWLINQLTAEKERGDDLQERFDHLADEHDDLLERSMKRKFELAKEKERADIAELAYQGLAENAVTRGEYQSLLDKHSLLSRAYRAQRDYLNKLEGREYKLREAIEEALRDATKWENPYEGYNDLQKLLDSLYPKEKTKPAVLEEEEA